MLRDNKGIKVECIVRILTIKKLILRKILSKWMSLQRELPDTTFMVARQLYKDFLIHAACIHVFSG